MSVTALNSNSKITPGHLKKRAYLYIRQSTLRQVFENTESTQRQYALRQRSDFVLYFYSNPAIWSRFGYEGPSNDQGGYLHRGFNDIDWIKREEL